MPFFERLREKPLPTKLVTINEQCQMTLAEMDPYQTKIRQQAWRIKRYKETGINPNYCARCAMVKIDGRALCHVHAGFVALEILEKAATDECR